MNTQHLEYMIEIERTRSISQAADNLYISQPNLSRILHEVEAGLGFRIFERTSRGVRPTTRGAAFLQHAKSILRELDSIEALGPRHAAANRLRLCIPRAASILEMTAEYLNSLPAEQNLDVNIRESHARQALERLGNGDASLGIIRFRTEYLDYFAEQTALYGLDMEVLDRCRYFLILPKNHPLAGQETVMRAELTPFPEISHNDNLNMQNKADDSVHRRIYTVDRLAQFALLEKIPGAYMWSSALPERYLERWGLVQMKCIDNQAVYHDALVCHSQFALNEIESGYISYMRENYSRKP